MWLTSLHDHHSLSYFFCLLLSLFYYSISLYLIWFLSFLILLDVRLGFSTHTLFLLIRYVHSFIITFRVGILRSATHDVFYALHLMHEGYGIISLGLLSLVSFRFFHPITLAYVTSCVLRPPWGHDFTHCAWRLTHGQYLRLVGDYFLEHDGWGVEVMDYTRAYPFYQWWIFRGDMIYTGAYLAHWCHFLLGWCLTLRHSQFASSLGLWMDYELRDDPTLGHSHFREHFYWRYSHSTRYSVLGHAPFINGWFF